MKELNEAWIRGSGLSSVNKIYRRIVWAAVGIEDAQGAQ